VWNQRKRGTHWWQVRRMPASLGAETAYRKNFSKNKMTRTLRATMTI
jgi:hypothetical protein